MSGGGGGGGGGGGDEVVLPLSSSDSYSVAAAHVSYSCGSCGYELNLNSCNRNISAIDAEYGKSMRRGVISFFSVDESRFTQKNKLRWLPYLPPKRPWRLFQRRTKLMCRSCGSYIGTAWNLEDVEDASTTWDGISARRMYEIKIRSLRPLSFERAFSLGDELGLSI